MPPLPIDEDDDADNDDDDENGNDAAVGPRSPTLSKQQLHLNHSEHNDNDSDTEYRVHQRQWRRRVSRSLGRSASSGNADNVKEILTDIRLRPFLDVNAPDDEIDGTTPLIYAACFGKPEVVRILLEAGAKVDIPDKRGWTALMWATTNNHSQVVELLLQHGASSTMKTAQGRTALDFVDTENQQLKEILVTQHQQDDPLEPYDDIKTNNGCSDDIESIDANATMDSDKWDDNDTKQKDDIDSNEDEDDDGDLLASFQSIHRFEWDRCLPDQMFVFGEENTGHILETAITRLTLPMKTRQEIWVPSNIIFLSARFAHYYSSRELLYTLLSSAVVKIKQVLKENMRDIHTLAFWMANMSQLLYYLKKDTGLVVATAEHQLEIAELICETYNLLVLDSEQRIEKVLETSMLDHEPIEGLTDTVEFQDDWQRFFRRNSSRMQHQLVPKALSPQSITSLLSSILYVLQSYHVHPAIIAQAIAQFYHFMSCELFNRILSNKKYLCRSKALQIRMNVTCLEEWARSSQLPSAETLGAYLEPVIQLLQLLQCVSQLSELELFANTIKTFDLLNPLQIKRAIINYRYEVAEPRLPDAIEKYIDQNSRLDDISTIKTIDDEDSMHQWAKEKRDSRHMLPFSLPSSSSEWKEQAMSPHEAEVSPTDGLTISDAMCLELKQRLGAEREIHRRKQGGIVPTIPEEWMDRLDCRLMS
ncbi:hypothetical protein BX666DRAFT_1869258 [Dichotomocladium elegans]|nr:hypothetical protein BX666DRAFT_1869258 [Dichotomocladium elegans]